MVLAKESQPTRATPGGSPRRRTSAAVVADAARADGLSRAGQVDDSTSRADALRRIVAEVSSRQDLGPLFEQVIDAAFDLFGVDRAGLWTYEPGPTPLHLAAQRGLSPAMLDVVARLPSDAKTLGMTALRERRVRVMTGDLRGTVADLRRMYRSDGMRTMCYVPIVFRDEILGLLVLYHRTDYAWSTDETDLARAFGDHIAVAMQNVRLMERLQHQQAELQHQLSSQRRLLEVNERLLSNLEPASVLDLIADSLKVIVPYDSLTVYRVDREAGVRRAVIARDRFADLILAHEGQLGVGITGWVIDHREAVLSNDAHLDPRSVQVPGTPEEPESMIVVPLLVGGEAIGTLNIGRMGEEESHFSPNEFELTKLFAGQASIALQNAETHGEVRIRAEQDALTGLRNHGAFQRELGEAVETGGGGRPFAVLMMDLDAFKAFNDSRGHPAGDALLAEIARAMGLALRDGRPPVPLWRRRVRGDPAGHRPGRRPRRGRPIAPHRRRTGARRDGPDASRSASASPASPTTGAGRTPWSPSRTGRCTWRSRRRGARDAGATGDDPYLRALDETALALLDRRDSTTLLETILTRACALLGTPHGYIYIIEPDGAELVLRHGTGLFEQGVGHRQPVDEGLGGEVYLTGKPVAIDDYDAYVRRAGIVPPRMLGAVVGVPLSSGDQVVGVIGLASASAERTFRDREIDALTRFAQLASIALDNARLVDVAQRGALYDPTTGLPNRELLTDRIAHALARVRPDDTERDRGDPARPRPVQGHQREPRPHRRRSAAGRGRPAARRVPPTRRHRRPLRRRRVRDRPRRGRRTRTRPGRSPSGSRPSSGRRSRSAGGSGSSRASMGIAIAEGDRVTPDELLREAEIAMVRAKGDPAIRHALFEPSMSTQTIERIDLENDLRRAIQRHELRAHYQPIVDLASAGVVGFEALVRWQHPTRGLVPPLAFIPLAEETGLIGPLGRWVLETACRQAAIWRDIRPGQDAARHVGQPLRTAVRPAGPRRGDRGRARRERARPGGAGARDHRVGRHGPVRDRRPDAAPPARPGRPPRPRRLRDRLLVAVVPQAPAARHDQDRPLVRGRARGVADRSIVEAVVALAHGLRIGVVAEGIETEAQRRRLMELGCRLGQGYLFSPPVPAADAGRLLRPRPGRRDRSRRPPPRPGPGSVPAAEEAEQEQEEVDEVQVELERADDGGLLDGPGRAARSPDWMRWTS